ncbi:uncharacterized protein lrrc41 isoform X2 [Hippocampus comes]|uniref:uncharacterized protein lrrc41 isoform X2 n=1 Tax=Hippocampus comes TaxID=109280 RepID=UPI00094F2827|nr:PREDICTED: leucine-rich repeat-containing protein 41 isoform X2 [Hippocampus comes]
MGRGHKRHRHTPRCALGRFSSSLLGTRIGTSAQSGTSLLDTSMEKKHITTLRDVCLKAVHCHFCLQNVGAGQILDLPADLLKDLLPFMNVCQLDELQTGLELKGVSTYSAWMKMYRKLVVREQRTFATSQDVQEEVMRQMFAQFLHHPSNESGLRSSIRLPTFLSTAVKYVSHVRLSRYIDPLVSLLVEEPLLSSLEKTVELLQFEWVGPHVSQDLAEVLNFLVHRFVDHGVVKHLILNCPSPNFLTSLFKERCHRYKPVIPSQPRESLMNLMSDEDGPCNKKLRWDKTACSVLHRCIDFSPGCRTPCQDLKIQSLEVAVDNTEHFLDIFDLLPTFDSLTTLTLKTPYRYFFPIRMIEEGLASALVSLSSRPHRSLRHLALSLLQRGEPLCALLQAYRELKELDVEIFMEGKRNDQGKMELEGEVLLERLSVNMGRKRHDADFLVKVLRACPHLLSLEVSVMPLPRGHSQKVLINTIAESNVGLTSLCLWDLNLSDCLEEIVEMLRVCKLEELHLADCRLLEGAADKAESLRQLVDAVKTVPSLRKLTLSNNGLAEGVHVLAQLFSGPTPSLLEYLHLGTNFIQPADLLRFAQALSSHPPPRHLNLDISTHPRDCNFTKWGEGLDKLRSFCHVLTDNWRR